MTFRAAAIQPLIGHSMGAMLLLHSSNQAVIEANIAPSTSPWYTALNSELGAVESLVVGWRQNGYLFFQQDILGQVIACGQAFRAARSTLDALIASLERDDSPATRDEVVGELLRLAGHVTAITTSLDGYLEKLKAYQAAVADPHEAMIATIAQVQSQEADIQAQIQQVNATIATLKAQVTSARQAISMAEAAEHEGTLETIFGILFAPFTGGLSLILAGIGVASITQAEDKINDLETTIAAFQQQIVAGQSELSEDQSQVATLQGLTLGVGLILSDLDGIATALDPLRITWATLAGELSDVARKVQDATTTSGAMAERTWFDAACDEWEVIVSTCQHLQGRSPPVPRRVTIGAPASRSRAGVAR